MYSNSLDSGFVPGPEKKNLVFLIGFLAFSLFLLRCAGQLPPPGGPRDLDPPRIVSTVPDSDAVRVEAGSVELSFSKYVDRRSLEESIFISPSVGTLKFDWSGKTVVINFSQPLRKNTTYVVNVGTDVVDVGREQTRMASGFTLAFSNGDSIDHGMIRGRVFDAKPEGVMIFAYPLDSMNADTLNPSHTSPSYIMQTGVGGSFTLSNLAFGTYRVIAVRDEFKNLLYDKEADQFGVRPGDITLSRGVPSVSGVWFRLSKEDTTRPFLSSVRAIDRYDVSVRFSEPVDSSTFDRSSVSVVDTLSGKTLPVALAWLQRNSPFLAGVMLSTPLDSGRTYRLSVSHAADQAGNRIDTAHAVSTFDGVARPDTLKPRIIVAALHDSARGYAPDAPLEIQFSKPVLQSPFEHGLRFTDTARKAIPALTRWLNPTSFVLQPGKPLAGKSWYTIRVIMDSLRDYRGNRYRDSVYQLRFQTLDLATTGVLEGSVVDDRGDSAKGEIHLTASSADAGASRQRTITLRQPGKFTMEQLTEGRYTLSAFRDSDSSGTYTFGLPCPFRPSERFTVYPDTVKVRARWGVEGIVIRFR